ncbi:MAG: thioredoxin family protein [Bacteroidetes bacterium]|nr:thioredoxin family protein [Bacteroidota bacterium]
MTHRFSFLIFLGFLALLPVSLTAQKASDVVRFSVTSATLSGQELTVSLQATITEPWHLYSTQIAEGGPVPTSFELVSAGRVTRVTESEAIRAFDPNFNMETGWFAQTARFTVTAQVDSVKAGYLLKARFMVCNESLCLPPVRVQIPVQITATGAKSPKSLPAAAPAKLAEPTIPVVIAAEPKTEAITPDTTTRTPVLAGTQVQGLSLWAFLLLAMSVGALTLLTPCVFPMIPITVSYFTKRQEGGGVHPVRDAFFFMVGIVLTFTLLGMMLAILFGASGLNQFATNPWINLGVALLFVFFALNLFGLFEIGLPSSWQTRLTSSSSGGGFTGLILMALTFTVTSFTCTMPFVGTILVSAAQGDWFFPAVGMMAFSLVFSIPFFLLAIFPSWIAKLPRSGNWMLSVKVLMGFLELAAAVKFFSNADLVWQAEWLTRDRFLAVWAAIMLISGLYVLGVFRMAHESLTGDGLHPVRVLIALFFFYFFVDFSAGIFGKPLGELDAFLPPRDYGQQAGWINSRSGNPSQEVWYENLESGLAEARRQGKPVFIDFTGYTCTNCRWMEQNIFTRPEIAEEFKNFVLIKLYTDGEGATYEANQTYQETTFGTVALPLYAVMTPDQTILGRFEGMTRNPQEFKEFLEQARAGK